MKLKNIFSLTLLFVAALFMQSCSDSDDGGGKASKLQIIYNGENVDQLDFQLGANYKMIRVNTDADWTASVPEADSWLTITPHAGYGHADSLQNTFIRVDVAANNGEPRTSAITVEAGGLTKVITVTQFGTATDGNDPFESAFDFVKNLVLGYNLGNTLDANPYDPTHSWWNPEGKTPIQWETSWGQPETTPEIINAIAEKGFNIIRVPVTWKPHMDENDIVDEAWMNRVEEVVKMVLDAGCYCVVNVQHDTGGDDSAWLIADSESYEANSARFKKLWTQIATRFKDYDEKLLFEAFNEILDASHNWNDPTEASAYTTVNKLEQDFVDAVRATGGNNEYRNLIVNPYSAGSTEAKLAGFTAPEDKHPNHILASIHSYDPYWFCNDGDDTQYYINVFDSNCEQELDAIFTRVHNRFMNELGIPYIYGEFGAIGTHPDIAERIKYAQYMTKKFKAYNTTGMWWMGLIDRSSLNWYENEIATALFDSLR